MTNTNYQNIQSKIETFPTIPGAAAKLMTLLDDPQASVSELEAMLQFDPGLSANVLKLANSIQFATSRKIDSVKQAVAALGSKKLIQLALASCVNTLMDIPVPGYNLPPGEFWRHSMAVSVAAEGLVQELNVSKAGVVFSTALLHDVGKLALGEFVKKEYSQIQEETSAGMSFEIAEREVLGTNHAEVGAKILEKWSLPPEVVRAVHCHHSPDAAGSNDPLTDIVHVANVLCLMVGIGVGREGLHYAPSASATKRLNLKADHLEIVASRTLQRVNELSDVFDAK
jgi:putative nucleotidyltransferase with HDIG domain